MLLQREDARIVEGADTTYRLEDTELTPDAAVELLRESGFSPGEAQEYLAALPTEDWTEGATNVTRTESPV